MSRSSKFIGAGLVCIGIGIVMTAGGIWAGGIPGVSVGTGGIRMTGDEESGEYILEKTELEAFSSVNMEVDYGNIRIIPSDGYYLEYRLSGHSREPEYKVENGTLMFDDSPGGKYLEFQIFGFSIPGDMGGYYVNLYVPEGAEFEKFILNNDYGDADVESLHSRETELYLESGDLTLEALKGSSAKISLDYGKISAGEFDLEEKLDMSLGSGDLEAEKADVGRITVENDYGNVTIGELTVEKEGEMTLDSGNLKLGGCSAESLVLNLDYGDAKVELADEASAYSMKLYTDYGSIQAPDTGRLTRDSSEESFVSEGTKGKSLEINCGSGDIHVGASSAD